MKFKRNESWGAGKRLRFKDSDGKKVIVETVSDPEQDHDPEVFIDVSGETVINMPTKKAVKLAKAILKAFDK